MRRDALTLSAVAAAVALAWPVAAGASCIPLTAAQQRAAAEVIFVGVALEGPTASGVQRFRVERYEKGVGGQERRVVTGVVSRGDGTGSTSSVSVEASAGERWRIYGTTGAGDVVNTNVCVGSARLADAPAPVGVEAAEPVPGGSVQSSLLLAIAVGAVVLVVAAVAALRVRARPQAGR